MGLFVSGVLIEKEKEKENSLQGILSRLSLKRVKLVLGFGTTYAHLHWKQRWKKNTQKAARNSRAPKRAKRHLQ